MPFLKHAGLAVLSTSILVSGCASDANKAVEREARLSTNRKISLAVPDSEFIVVIDKSDKVKNICTNSQSCAGLFCADSQRQSCAGLYDGDNDAIRIGNSAIGLGASYKGYQLCGYGMLFGNGDAPEGVWEIDNTELKECNSRFYKTTDRFMTTRLVGGLVSLGTIPILMRTVHEKSFDRVALANTAQEAQLNDLQALLYSNEIKNQSLGTLSSRRIDIGNLDKAYKALIKTPITSDSVVLIDDDTNKPLYVFNLKGNEDKELPVAVNQQLSDFFSSVATRSVTSTEATGVNVNRLIPAEIRLPAMPPVPQLVKSEYETKAEFEARVKKAVTEREDAIRNLQQQYQRDVYNRNQYIAALGESWQQYLDGKASTQNELVNKLKKNQSQWARLLYAMNLGKFTASDMSYDAESKSLYFTAASTRYGFKQKMVAKVSASAAQSIKEAGNYSLTPKLNYQNDKIKMEGLVLADTKANDDYATIYTDINFKPEAVSVKVASTTKINKETSALFKSYEQKPQALVDSNTKEVWYIETRNSLNAKMPEWFATPEHSNNVVGYGVGNSREEAMTKARTDLAYTVKTKISASTDVLQKDNTFRSYQDVTQRAQTSTDVELKAGDYTVYKQQEADGRYYVALCYRCN